MRPVGFLHQPRGPTLHMARERRPPARQRTRARARSLSVPQRKQNARGVYQHSAAQQTSTAQKATLMLCQVGTPTHHTARPCRTRV
eukprot:3097627-Rhodomonas_salina.3